MLKNYFFIEKAYESQNQILLDFHQLKMEKYIFKILKPIDRLVLIKLIQVCSSQ
jgi:hypothetical protein